MCKRCTHFEYSFLIDNVHAKWWIHCLPISLTTLLSHATSIYDRPKRVPGGFFWCFPGNNRIWATWAFSIICVCMTSFKVSIPPLNRCFQRSRDGITLIKPLFLLNSILSHQKAEFQIFPLFWKFANSKVKLATLVEGYTKAPFSIATTSMRKGGCNSIPWIALFYPWFLPYNAEC